MAGAKITKKLNKRAVDAFSAINGKLTRMWDTELKGFNMLAYANGRKVYVVGYRIKGQTTWHWYTIGKHGDPWTPDSAREKAKQILVDAGNGINPKTAVSAARASEHIDTLTVAKLIDLYLEEGPIDNPDKRKSSWGNDRTYLNNHVRPLLGKVALASLKPSDISKFQNDVLVGKSARKSKGKGRAVTGGHGAAVHAVRSFSAAIGWAASRDLVASNPCNKIRKLQDGVRERYLTRVEATTLFQAIDKLLDEGAITQKTVDCLIVISYTAARVSEITGLKWSEVDFDRRLLILPPLRHKTGGVNKPKAIPIAGKVMEILAHRKEGCEPDDIYVFPSPRSRTGHLQTVRHAFDKIKTRSGLDDFRVHDFRHAYASFAINAGESLKTIGANLGHRKASTTERYAHLLVDTRRPVAESIEAVYEQSRNSS